MVYQRVQQPVPAIHRKKEGYLARYSPHQGWWFETDASGTPSGTILELLGDFLARLPQIEFPTGLGLEHDSEFWGGNLSGNATPQKLHLR